jgi:dipeptidase D
MKISDLNPKLVWEAFDEITKVPRPTHHLAKMEAFLVDWAKRHNLDYNTDEVGNVVMRVPATPGCENAPVIILQGHQDMVAEKAAGVQHDFFNDPIKTVVDGEWVRAEGTTLGADNGMGCASAMACLIDPDLQHGPLEALFTVDEEQGLIGANGLQPGFVTGEILLNLDSEEMGQFVIGCAGGKVAISALPYKMVAMPAGHVCYRVEVGNLKGGHSGMEINLGRANANQVLCRFLWEVNHETPLEVVEINGGGLANAIPRDAHAVVAVKSADAEKFLAAVKEYSKLVHSEYAAAENPDFKFEANEEPAHSEIIEPKTAHDLIAAVFACPNGVQGMSAAVPGLVETSCNLASVKMHDGVIEVTVHQRSSVDSRRDEICDRVSALFGAIGADVRYDDAYVGWSPNPNSRILQIAVESYKDMFHAEPKVEALHAGLECGLFLEKMPNLDMVSFGPTLKDIHSPNEKCNIKAVEDFYRLLKDMLTRLSKL